MMLPQPRRGSRDPGLGTAAGARRRAGAWVLSFLAGLLLLAVLGDYAYQTRWPPRVDDRELARIGPPVSGARPVGGPHTTGGSVVCVDECLTEGQFYAATGSVTQLGAALTRHLEQRGYAIRSGLGCTQEGPPVLASGHYELDCSVTASSSKFTASVTVQVHRSEPSVPLPAAFTGQYAVPGPPPDITLRPGDGILVEVSS
jgi:hypothetical protein